METMFPQISAFFADLKLGIKSSLTKKGSYENSSSRRRHHPGDEVDESRSQLGCLGRSVSMEWGLASSRKKRAASSESLDRMSGHVRSAVSLMELTQASQPRQVPGVGGGGGGTNSATDTWSSSGSGSQTSSNRRSRQQRNHECEQNGITTTATEGCQPSRDQQQRNSGSTPNGKRSNNHYHMNNGTQGNAGLSPPVMEDMESPFTPQGIANHRGNRRRATSACPPPPPPPSSSSTGPISRPRPPGKPPQRPTPTQTPRRIRTDNTDGPGFETWTAQPAALIRPQSNGKVPIPRRNILPLANSNHLRTTESGGGQTDFRVSEPERALRGPEAISKPEDLVCLIDSVNGAAYYKGKLLGKGGFARCYELSDIQNLRSYAGKIISKARLTRDTQKQKILREVELHRGLQHRNVVKFQSYFEDELNVYIVLEYCSRKSVVHVLKNRKTLTEPEVRYYMHSLVNGLSYIHGQHVIHRDLKLGNLLLNENMELKIADFGLATKVEYEGEKKMTVCGTPNYIAPEVLQKRGHSYEADIWALGCIMFALLCGRPPFETSTLKETYMKIVTNKYVIPPHVSLSARDLIHTFLTLEPTLRPALNVIPTAGFFSDGHFPTTLSPTTCDTRPKFPMTVLPPARRPRSTMRNDSLRDENSVTSLAQSKGSKKSASQIITRNKTPDPEYIDSKYPEGYPQEGGSAPSIPRDDLSADALRDELSTDLTGLSYGPDVRLHRLLTQSIEMTSRPNRKNQEARTPGQGGRLKAKIYVTKWVDYSNKYGFGFQLSNRTIGILFNDDTRMLLHQDGTTIAMCDPSGVHHTFNPETAPADYQKKVTLLLYFAQYMDTHLIPGGQLLTRGEQNVVFLKKWFRTDRAIVLFLTDGTLQVNFLGDHTKVILNPDGQDYLLTLVNSSRQVSTYPLKTLHSLGCSPQVLDRLQYVSNMLERTINIEGGQRV